MNLWVSNEFSFSAIASIALAYRSLTLVLVDCRVGMNFLAVGIEESLNFTFIGASLSFSFSGLVGVGFSVLNVLVVSAPLEMLGVEIFVQKKTWVGGGRTICL